MQKICNTSPQRCKQVQLYFKGYDIGCFFFFRFRCNMKNDDMIPLVVSKAGRHHRNPWQYNGLLIDIVKFLSRLNNHNLRGCHAMMLKPRFSERERGFVFFYWHNIVTSHNGPMCIKKITSHLKNTDYVQGQSASRWKSAAYGCMWAFWRGSQHRIDGFLRWLVITFSSFLSVTSLYYLQ